MYPVDWKKWNMVEIKEMDLDRLMGMALKEAKKAFSKGEVPVGAVVARFDGEIVAGAHNRTIALNDPTAHAEILALREAGACSGNYRLTELVLVVTIEPCLMCMGAAVHARISRLVIGTPDEKTGAAGSLYNIAQDKRLNHQIDVVSGVREAECRDLMQAFFRNRR